jgi:hypothetical protein
MTSVVITATKLKRRVPAATGQASTENLKLEVSGHNHVGYSASPMWYSSKVMRSFGRRLAPPVSTWLRLERVRETIAYSWMHLLLEDIDGAPVCSRLQRLETLLLRMQALSHC